jgi:glutamyl-tRNA reductase
MNILCLGISHHTAPVEIREQLWFSNDEVPQALAALRDEGLREAVLVSTCNRTELYYVPAANTSNGTPHEPLWKILGKLKRCGENVTEQHFYTLEGDDAVRHVYSVAAGIDSMVLGDVQILSQMKDAFTIGQELSTTGIILNRLFNTAFHAGKRARTETEIAEGAVSVSYAAAELASKIFEDLSERTALLIGAGETGELTAKHLTGRNLGKLLVTNRTRERAEELTGRLGGETVDFASFLQRIPSVDIIISSVNAPAHILSAADLRAAVKSRDRGPLVIIDIGVPRNIDPAANGIAHIFLNDIDSLNHIVDANLSHRRAEVPKIEAIIGEELMQFQTWYRSLDVTPTIQQLREQFEDIRRGEVEKHLHHFSPRETELVEMLTKRIVNKILHTPMVNLRGPSEGQPDHDARTRVSIIRHLFGLDHRKD